MHVLEISDGAVLPENQFPDGRLFGHYLAMTRNRATSYPRIRGFTHR